MTPRLTPERFQPLFDPRGVVVAADASHPGKFGFVAHHNILTQGFAGPVFATKSIASEVLNGKRRLTYDHVDRLAQFFHVSPSVFYR